MNIYVGNLSRRSSENELRSAFEGFGEVTSATIIKDKFSGESRGFGFVEMPNEDEARASIDALNGKDLGGREITVNEARARTEEKRGFSGNRGSGSGFGGGSRFDNNRSDRGSERSFGNRSRY